MYDELFMAKVTLNEISIVLLADTFPGHCHLVVFCHLNDGSGWLYCSLALSVMTCKVFPFTLQTRIYLALSVCLPYSSFPCKSLFLTVQ